MRTVEDLVSRWTWKDSVVKLSTEVKCPVADVIIKTGNNTYQIEVAIVRHLPAGVLLGRDMLLGNAVPLLEYTLKHMEIKEIKQALQTMLQNRVLKYRTNYSGGFREVCTSCRDKSSNDQEVSGGGSNEEPGE